MLKSFDIVDNKPKIIMSIFFLKTIRIINEFILVNIARIQNGKL